jgi:hypothetical protein
MLQSSQGHRLMQDVPHGGGSQAEAAMFVRYWWQVGRSPIALHPWSLWPQSVREILGCGTDSTLLPCTCTCSLHFDRCFDSGQPYIHLQAIVSVAVLACKCCA